MRKRFGILLTIVLIIAAAIGFQWLLNISQDDIPKSQETPSLMPSLPVIATQNFVPSPQPTLQPSSTPGKQAFVSPPGATLTIKGQNQAAGIGSYCWTTSTGESATTACAKRDGVLTTRKPLIILLVTGVLIVSFSGCVSFQQPPSPTKSQATTLPTPPVVTDTSMPTSTTAAPVSSFAGLRMFDANHGWAWTAAQRLLRTSDGGLTWMDRTPGKDGSVEDAFFIDNQTGWISIFLPDMHFPLLGPKSVLGLPAIFLTRSPIAP